MSQGKYPTAKVSLPSPVAGDVTFPLVIGGLVLSSRSLEPFIGLRDQLHGILAHALHKVLLVVIYHSFK